MISKERFVKTLDFIKKMHSVEDDINDIFRRNNMEFSSVSYCEYENELFELLSDCMNDTGNWICWWIYDMNCGRDVENGVLVAEEEDGREIDLTTPEKLYDYLVKGIDKPEAV